MKLPSDSTEDGISWPARIAFCRNFVGCYPDIALCMPAIKGLEWVFDTVASAFHWVPEEIGYSKVYAMLKPGGAFARFAIDAMTFFITWDEYERIIYIKANWSVC